MNVSVSSRDRVLQAGADLVSREGLSGVSMGVIADMAGMSKSGLFAIFKSKDALQIGLLAQSAELARQSVIAPAYGQEPGIGRLKVLIDSWLGWPERAGLNGGCPIASTFFELDDCPDSEVRQYAHERSLEWFGIVNEIVRDCVELGHLRKDLDVEQFIWELNGIYLSHHVATRFSKQVDARDRAQVAIDRLLTWAGQSENSK